MQQTKPDQTTKEQESNDFKEQLESIEKQLSNATTLAQSTHQNLTQEIHDIKQEVKSTTQKIDSLKQMVENSNQEIGDIRHNLITCVEDTQNLLQLSAEREQSLVEDFIFNQTTLPLLKGYLNIIQVTAAKTKSEDLAQTIHSYVLEFLNNYNITEITAKSGDAFNPKLMQISKLIPTKNQELDKTIESVVQPGFTHDGKVIREQRVNLFKYQATSTKTKELQS